MPPNLALKKPTRPAAPPMPMPVPSAAIDVESSPLIEAILKYLDAQR
jgi:hypothetical protein